MAPKFEQMRLASPGWRRCGIAVAVALCFPIGATAGGTDPRFIFGGGRIVTGKNFTDVFNSPNAIIEWKTLSTAQKEILRFVQKNGDSWVMNRITGGDPSVFLGTLSSNGHVVIINQNGVAFGPSAQVNVAGLVVSGLNIANSDFLDGKRVFDGSAGAGRVLNEGSLRTLKGGSVVLVGGSVENRGVIEAPNGDILLLAGRSANLVDPAVPAIQVEVHAADNAAVNLGRMTGGHIGIYAGAIRHAGIVNANSAVVGENGKIVFKAVQGLVVEPGATVSASGSTGGSVTLESEGTTRIAGSVDARGTEGNGGAIRILGDAVSLEGNTRVDASGRTGGGIILVGGAYQGHGPERNASRTFVSAEAVLDASAGDRGDGGLVVVWSERATGFEGRIAARGGTRGGAGGSAEVSGKGFLDYRGTADLRAPKGRTGTLLLDPDSIDIGATADIDGLGGDLSGATILSTDFPGIASKITAAAVVAQLDAADVSLQALNNITVSSAIDASANTNSHGLTLQTTAAGSSITLNEGVKTKNGAIAILSGTGGITQAAGKSVDAGNATITLNGGGGNVTLQGTLTTTNATASAITVSNAAALQIGNMSAALGGTMTVSHSGAGSQTAGTVIGSAARFAKAGAGTMTLSQANTHTGGTAVNAGTLVVSGGTALPDANGTVTVAAGATLDLANSEAIGALSGAGNVTLNANTLTTGGSGTSTTFSGAISGTGGMTKTGAGNFTVSGANAYTGATSVLAGTLTLGANNVLADTTAVSVAAGATLDLATFNDTVGSLTNAGTVAGTGTLTAATYNLNGGTIDGNLGAGTMAQLTGTTVLNGTAAAGTVNVTGGSLQLGAADRLSNAAAVSIAAGAVLDLSTANDTVGSLTSAGTLAGSGTLTATTYTLNGGSIDANLGAGTLTQSSGSTTLNGTVGALTVNVDGGTLVLGASNRLANAAAVTVASGATLDVGSFTDTVGTFASGGTLSGTGTLTATSYTLNGGTIDANLGAGTLTQASGSTTLNGTAGATTVNIDGGTLLLGAADRLANSAAVTVASGATLDLAGFDDTVGSFTSAGTLSGTGTLTAGTYTLNGGSIAANLGAGTLTQNSGSTSLGGTAGAATVNVSGGTLVLAAGERLLDTAALNVGGGTLDIGANSETVGAVALTSGGISGTSGVLTGSGYAVQSGSISAILAGTGALTKTTAGTVTLSGANTYTGATTISAGTLALGADNALGAGTDVTVSGGTLDLGTANATVPSLTLSSGSITGTTGILSSATDFDVRSGTVSGRLGGAVGLVKTTGGTVTLSGTGSNTYTGLTDVQSGTLALGASDVLADASTVKVSGGTLSLGTANDTVAAVQMTSGTITGTTGILSSTADFDLQAGTVSGRLGGSVGLVKTTAGTVTLSGANTYTGLTDVQAGTLTLGASDVLADASTVKVSGGTLGIGTNSDTVGGVQMTSGNITGTTGVLGSTTDFDLQAGSVTAKLGGSVGLVKTTAGTVTLSGANTYTGLTDVQAGTLALGAAGVLADASALNVAAGATFDMNNHSETVAAVTSGGTLTGTGGTTLTAASYTFAGGTVDVNLGAGTLTQSSGSTTLNGTVGALTVNVDGGTLVLGASNRLANTAAVTVASGATLDLASFNDTVGTFASGGTLSGTGTLTATSYTLSGGTIDANLGAGTLTQASGSTTLNGTAGATTVNIDGGTLLLGAADRLANTASISVNGGSLDIGANNDSVGAVTLVGGSIDGTSGVLTGTSYAVQSGSISAILGGTAGLTKTTAGTVTLSGANTYSGTTTITAGTLAFGAHDALGTATDVVVNGGTLDIGAFNATVGGVQLTTGTIAGTTGTLTSGTDFDLRSGTVSAALGGAVGADKTTAGSVTLSGTNTYTGTTAVASGTLVLSGGTAVPDTGDVTVASGATLSLTASETVGSIAGPAGSAVALGANTLTTGGGAKTFSGVIAGSGGLVLTGASSFTLAGANTFTGLTDVQGGILTLNGGAAIADTAAVQVAAAAGIVLGANETIGSLAGAGDVTLGTRILTTGGSGASTTHSGVITGSGGIVKQGAGTFTLAGANTYTGLTDVQAGTLALGAADVLADTAPVTVSGGTFDIAAHNDTVGAVTLASGTIAGSGGALTGSSFALQSGTVTAILAGAAAASKTTAGTVTLSGVNSYAGGTTVTGGSLIVTDASGLGSGAASIDATAAAATLDLRGVTVGNDLTLKNGAGAALLKAGSGAAGATGVVTLTGSGGNLSAAAGTTLTVDGKVTGSGGLTVSGPGTVVLTNGANDYTTGTVLASGSQLAVTAAGALGGAATTVPTGATLDLRNTGGIQLTSPVSLNGGTITASTGTSTLGPVAVGATGSTVSAAAGAQLDGGGAFTDGGAHGFTIAGAGIVNLTNPANDFGGTVTVSAGSVSIANHNSALLTLAMAGAGATSVTSTGTGGIAVSGTSAGTLDLSAVAGISLIGDVTTSGLQTYLTPVTLGADVVLTAPAISFADTVNGARTLDIAGDVQFGGAVGGGTALTSLSVSGTGTLGGPSVRTTGDQSYGGSVVLNADNHLTAANAVFSSALDGAHALQVTGNARFDAAVGATTPLASLSVSGTAAVNGGSVRTTGNQVYSGATTLGADTILTALTASFGGTLNGAHALDIIGAASFGGVVGGGSPLASISVSGATQFGGGGATTSGGQTYSGPVTLSGNTTLKGTGLAFGSTIDGGHDLVLDAGVADIGFAGAIGSGAALAALTIDNARNVDFAGGVNVATLVQTAGTGTTTIDVPITTTAPAGISITNQDVDLKAGGALSSGGGGISLAADGSLGFSGGTIAAGTGAVTFGVMTPGTAMTYGAGPGVDVGPTAMAAIVSASAVRIGNANAGDILVAAPLANPAATSSVALVSGGNITQSAPISVTNLRVAAAGDATLDDPANSFTNLAATMSGSDKTLKVVTAGNLNIGAVDGVAGINSPGVAVATTSDVSITVGGSLSQSEAIVADMLTLRAPAGSVNLLHNHDGSLATHNDVLSLDVSALGSISFFDATGYKVLGAAGSGLHFDSLGGIDFSALLAGDHVQIDAGSGDLSINSAGAIGISGPGLLTGRNISISTPDTQDITLTGGSVAGISNDVLVKASGSLTLHTRNLTVSGGVSTAGPGETLKNDAILQAGGTLSITTAGDFSILGGTAATTSSGAGNAGAQANAFVQAPNLRIDVGGNLLIKGGDVKADSSAGGITKSDASAILLVGNAKDIKVGGNLVLAGGTSSVFLGTRNSGSALAVLDPDTPMTIATGGSLALFGGSAKAPIAASATIFNSGPITLDVGGTGTFADTFRATGIHKAGLLLIGGRGSGRFDLNDNPVLNADLPVKYTLHGGSYTVITSLPGGDAFIQSRAAIGIDHSLLGYILFATNNETETRGKRSLVDQATQERTQAGQCK